MATFKVTALLAFLGVFAYGRVDAGCPPAYQKIAGHTMCMRDSPNLKKAGVSRQDIQTILSVHNNFRANVKPAASDLTTLAWDDELAAVAQKWANQCRFAHDKHRSVPGLGVGVGQNLAGGQSSWTKAIESWYSEVNYYNYGRTLAPGEWKKIGHYTQMVMSTTHRVGCGFSYCSGVRYPRIYVCNYASGQMQEQFSHPYKAGRRCSACPGKCVKGLCDCGGRICKNGGKLDISTCTCKCPDLYKGPTCGEVNCPNKDIAYCGRHPFVKSNCGVYTNIPGECPHMCGLC
ncbi:hypothetical protein ACOMHN_040635 [Nucella lapillus]